MCMQAKKEAADLELKATTAEAQVEAAKQQAQTYRVSHVCLLNSTGAGTGDCSGKAKHEHVLKSAMPGRPAHHYRVKQAQKKPNREHICAG